MFDLLKRVNSLPFDGIYPLDKKTNLNKNWIKERQDLSQDGVITRKSTIKFEEQEKPPQGS